MDPARDRAAASRADTPPVDLEILPERKHAAQLEEPKREHARVGDNRPKLPRRNGANPRRMGYAVRNKTSFLMMLPTPPKIA